MAFVGASALGLLAVRDAGVDLGRVAHIPDVGADGPTACARGRDTALISTTPWQGAALSVDVQYAARAGPIAAATGGLGGPGANGASSAGLRVHACLGGIEGQLGHSPQLPQHHRDHEHLPPAAEAQDVERICELFAEEIDWLVRGNPQLAPWVGPARAKSEVPGYFRDVWAALVPGRSVVTVEAVVVAVFDHVAAPTSCPFHTDVALRLTVTDGARDAAVAAAFAV